MWADMGAMNEFVWPVLISTTPTITETTPMKTDETQKICPICCIPGCIERRGESFHAGTAFDSVVCDYTGTPPFPDSDGDPTWCVWCGGTGHPYGDESYG